MSRQKFNIFNYTVTNKNETTLDVYIDGAIVTAEAEKFYQEYWGDDTSISYRTFRDKLLNSDATIFNIYINSPGGIVIEAMAMHDLIVDLQNKGKQVNAEGRGIIASSATYVLMAAKKPKMSANSWLMIHNVSGFVYGDVNEMERGVQIYRQFNDASTEFYANRTGIAAKEIGKMMNNETWMTAQEAKDKGFIDEVTSKVEVAASPIQEADWQFNNRSVLNIYNQQLKSSDMIDMEKILQAIKDGFKQFAGGATVKDNTVSFSDEVVNSLSDAVFNAIKPALEGQLTEESIQNTITVALAASNYATKAEVTALEGKFANLVTKDDINNVESRLTNAVVAALGNKNIKSQEQKEEKKPIQRTANGKKSEFANVAQDTAFWMVPNN